jgi:hypothetical protein
MAFFLAALLYWGERRNLKKLKFLGRHRTLDTNPTYSQTMTSVLPSGGGTIGQNVRTVMYDSTLDGLTAHAGGTQAGGVLILNRATRFTTVGTTGDSATLPLSQVGTVIWIRNDGANSMNIFPAVGDAINALGANAAFALAAATSASFRCTTAGHWYN